MTNTPRGPLAIFFLIGIAIVGIVATDICLTMHKRPKYVPMRQKVLDYPCKDNSPTIRAAETRVEKKIKKIEHDYCSKHLTEYPCGAWYRRNGKWEKVR